MEWIVAAILFSLVVVAVWLGWRDEKRREKYPSGSISEFTGRNVITDLAAQRLAEEEQKKEKENLWQKWQ